VHNPDSFSTTSCRICVDPMRLRGLHNAPGQCQCPAPLQREAPGGGQNTSGRPAIQAPSVKTPRPQTLQQSCTHARGSAAGTRTGRAILDGPRMSITSHDRVGEACVCLAHARARTDHAHVPGRTDHAHAPRRGRNTHMHVSVAPPPAPRRPARPCVEPRHERAGRQGARHPPQKQRTRWQPASIRASRPRPRPRAAAPARG
jgi:hypothetical protein